MIISRITEDNLFVPDGTEIISRNKEGCDKCTFGITDLVVFSDSLTADAWMLEKIIKNKISTIDVFKKIKGAFDCSSDSKIAKIFDKMIDPMDLINK